MPDARSIARLVLRATIAITAVVEIVRGDPLYGIYCLALLTLLTVLSRLASRAQTTTPIAIEVVLLWLMVADMTLGISLGLYVRVPWYDKALHFSSSILIGMLGFLAIYIVHVTGKIRLHPIVDGFAILLVTLGLGALWEIGEYLVDIAFSRRTQGSPSFNMLDDTMLDLMLDGVGAIVAGIVGPIYMRWSRRSRHRVQAIARLIANK